MEKSCFDRFQVKVGFVSYALNPVKSRFRRLARSRREALPDRARSLISAVHENKAPDQAPFANYDEADVTRSSPRHLLV